MMMPVQSLLLDRSQGSEVLLANPGGTLVHEGLLPAQSNNATVTGVIHDPEDRESPWLVQVGRVSFHLSPRLARLDDETLPPTWESLDGLDQLVVASDRIAANRTGLRAIRRWLHAGRRIWIRADRVSPATVSLLLGEECPYTVVDRLGLTHWKFFRERIVTDPENDAFYQTLEEPATGNAGRVPDLEMLDRVVEGKIDDFEEPVEMVRVMTSKASVVHSLNGWPASFWIHSGRGLVLFTTAGPRVWYRPRPNYDRVQSDAQNPVARFQETPPLRDLVGSFFKPRLGPLLPAEVFSPLLVEQIGYRILGRGPVVVILGGFCLGLAAAAWGVWRRGGSFALLGWAGPLAALAAGLLLIVLGYQTREKVPSTVASAQLVEITPGAEDASATGLIALYDVNSNSTPPLGSTNGGVFLPNFKGQEGPTRRIVWTDLGCWHWENLALAPGLHLAPFESNAHLSEPVSVHSTFGPEGVVGKFARGPLRNSSDAILSFPSHRNLAVRFTGAEGDFTAGPADQLASGQYLSAELLSGEQRRRQEVMQTLLEKQSQPRFPTRPTLLVWTSPLDLGFTFPEETRQIGSALVAVPLALDRPAPGTRLTIPAPFLSYRGVKRSNLNLSALYNPQRNEWVSSRSQPAQTILRFQIPPELLPLRIERAELEVDLNAQTRRFEIFFHDGERSEVLASSQSPVGKLHLVIDRPEALRLDSGGGLYLGLSIGEAGRLLGEEKASSEWKINDLQLQLTGRVPED